MKLISDEKYERMRGCFNPDIARFLANSAGKGRSLFYQDLADEFGGIARGYGDRLGGITIFCRERNLPLLPVIVVAMNTGRPSEDAALYKDLGITDFDAEQEACFKHDWTTVEF